LNVHRVSNVRQREIHTAEPLVRNPSPSEDEIDIATLKMYKTPGNDQIPAEMFQAGGEVFCFEIHKFIHSVWNKEDLPDQWKESIILPIHKRGDKTECSNYRGISLLSTSYKILSNILLRRLLGIVNAGFDVTDQLLIRSFAFFRYWRKNGSTMRQYINYS
jgi:hypothetical protein